MCIDTFTLSIGGLVAQPGVYDLGTSSGPLRRRLRRIAVVDLLAAVCLDAAADVLAATCADGRIIAVPIRDVLGSDATLQLVPQGLRLVVPGWCERHDDVIVSRLMALTFGEFLRTPPEGRQASDREGLM
jgi:hypothetical protein